MRIGRVEKPKIVGSEHPKGMRPAGWMPSHMAIEIDDILIAIPVKRDEIKTKRLLDRAIGMLKEGLDELA